jgi:hypothetical protein
MFLLLKEKNFLKTSMIFLPCHAQSLHVLFSPCFQLPHCLLEYSSLLSLHHTVSPRSPPLLNYFYFCHHLTFLPNFSALAKNKFSKTLLCSNKMVPKYFYNKLEKSLKCHCLPALLHLSFTYFFAVCWISCLFDYKHCILPCLLSLHLINYTCLSLCFSEADSGMKHLSTESKGALKRKKLSVEAAETMERN